MRSRPNSWLSTLTQLGFTRKKSKAKQRGKHRSLRVESLEDRRLLAITVTDSGDMGPGTLRDAIASAMPNETIDFDASLDGDTIMLNSQLVVGKNLTIDASGLDDGIILNAGNGPDAMFATGDGHRIFFISSDVVLRGLTLTGGDPTPDYQSFLGLASAGGAIFNQGNLTIEASKITGNAAVETLISNLYTPDNSNVTALGGGIFTEFGSLTITQQSTVTGNLAKSDSSGKNLESNIGQRAYGGGIYTLNSNVTISETVISGNRVLVDATGFDGDNSNAAFNSYARGGGIAAVAFGSTQNLIVEKSTISNNSALTVMEGIMVQQLDGDGTTHGGGLYLKEMDSIIRDSTISGNQATTSGVFAPATILNVRASGGGVRFASPNSSEIISSTITNNTAAINHLGPSGGIAYSDVYGGGIAARGNLDNDFIIAHSTIYENQVINSNTATSSTQMFSGGGISNRLGPASKVIELNHVIAANNLLDGSPNDVATALGSNTTGSNNFFTTDGDPDLGDLAMNGGPTLTHAPNCGSPVVEAGDSAALPGIGTVPSFDQRGFGRVFDLPGPNTGPIDIGAVEIGLFDVPVLAADFEPDGDVDGRDFVTWQGGNGITAGATKQDGDANGDGMVNQVDLMIWSQQYGAGLGMAIDADFNNDMVVDHLDYVIWQQSYGVNANGDADQDGDTDEFDFLAWQAKFAQAVTCDQWVHSVGAFSELAPGEILVSTLRDENDGNYSLGDLSLREALAIADSTTGPDTIKFASNLHGTIELTQGELDIDTDVDIVGPGSGRLTIDAQSNSRGFNISDGVSTNLLDVSISGLTITGGYVAGSGAGIENDENLELTNVVLTDNVATNLGGAINHDFGKLSLIDSTLHSNEANHGGGVYGFFKTIDSLEIDGSTFSENEAASLGGGLFFKNVDAGGVDSSAKIINSTFSGNTAGSHSGGLRIRGSSQASTDVTIVNSTITGNEAPTAGGVFAYPTATVTMHNSILAGNSVTGSSTWTTDASGNIGGTTSSPSLNNLIGVGNTGLGVSNGVNQNLVGTYSTPQAAGLEVLADNGGPTQTHALLSTSDAIDAGSSSAATSALSGLDFVDQRGYNRNFDDPTETGGVDIGAYERGLIVTTANDENDVTFDFDDLSLREALAALSNYQANSLPESNVIEFDDSVVTSGSITLYDQLDVAEDVNITGPGADRLEIDATGHDRVFDIDAGVTATISGLEMFGGNVAGIKSAGNLTLDGVEVSDNAGRGIETVSQSVLDIRNSTVADNGDIGLYLDNTTTTVSNVTVSGNTGAGAFVFNGTATFTNATITENAGGASAGGILAVGSADTTLHNSIVAGNTSSLGMGTVDLTGAIGAFSSSSSNNLIGDAGNSGLSDGVTAAELGLTSLDYHNGGPTRTHALLNGSVAIDAADDSLLLALGYLEDQRGSNRYEDGDADGFARADIGAFELAADEFFGTI